MRSARMAAVWMRGFHYHVRSERASRTVLGSSFQRNVIDYRVRATREVISLDVLGIAGETGTHHALDTTQHSATGDRPCMPAHP